MIRWESIDSHVFLIDISVLFFRSEKLNYAYLDTFIRYASEWYIRQRKYHFVLTYLEQKINKLVLFGI